VDGGRVIGTAEGKATAACACVCAWGLLVVHVSWGGPSRVDRFPRSLVPQCSASGHAHTPTDDPCHRYILKSAASLTKIDAHQVDLGLGYPVAELADSRRRRPLYNAHYTDHTATIDSWLCRPRLRPVPLFEPLPLQKSPQETGTLSECS
jgi:hypothetical protein